MVYFVRKMTAKKPCKYGRFGLCDHEFVLIVVGHRAVNVPISIVCTAVFRFIIIRQ